jgi:hypothetical protein
VSLLSVLTDGGPKEGEQWSLVIWLQGGRNARRDDRIPHPAGGPKIGCGGAWQVGVWVQPCEQPGSGDLQRMREAEQRQHRNVASPLFNLTEIPLTDACAGGECRLGQAPLLPVVTEGGAKTLEWRVVRV